MRTLARTMKLFLCAVFAAVFVSVNAPIRGSHLNFYTIKYLGTLCPEGQPICDDAFSRAFDLNIFAQVVGETSTVDHPSGRGTAFRTGPGGAPMSALGGISRAFGINDQGTAVGEALLFAGATQAFIWPANAPLVLFSSLLGCPSNPSLPVPFGCVGHARAANNFGTFVGTANSPGAGPSGGPLHAFRFGLGLLDPGTLGGTESDAHDINDKGDIVGVSRNIFGVRRAFFRPAILGASLQPLGTTLCGPAFGACESFAYAINESGVIVGESNTFSEPFLGPLQAFRFRPVRRGELPHMEKLGTLCTHTLGFLCASAAYDINDVGQIVGSSDISLGGTAAFLYANDTMTDLNAVLSPADQSLFRLIDAHGINDLGQIVGTMVNLFGGGGMRAYLLTPPLGIVFPTLAQLVASMDSDATSGNARFGQGLQDILAAAEAAVEREDNEAALGQIGAYEEQVRALVRSRRLPEIQGTKLMAGATLIRTLMDAEMRR
jgi:probable HAF family extracellular repeat protein